VSLGTAVGCPRGSVRTAVAGSVLISSLGDGSYDAAMIVLALIGTIGFGATVFLPAKRAQRA
jgi:hypothetical protein